MFIPNPTTMQDESDENFLAYLERLIDDLEESGMEATADDFRECARRIKVQSGSNILRHTTSEWDTTSKDLEGNATVLCHSRMVQGVLCRWWGDGPIPDGVKLINEAASNV